MFTFSQQGHRAYFKTRITLSGAVLPDSILWTHTNTLFDTPRDPNPGLEALIHKDIAGFIKEHGRPSERGAVLDLRTVTALEASENSKTAHRATALQSFILENRNRLLEDEARLASLLGVEMGVMPTCVQWDRWTRRIDVAWTARTTNVLEAVKLGILAPPEDATKRDLVRRMLSEKRWCVKRALNQFWDNEVEFEEWWVNE
jgi:hypothetical protein